MDAILVYMLRMPNTAMNDIYARDETGNCMLNMNKKQHLKKVTSSRPITVEPWFRFQASPCEIYGGQSCIGTGFSFRTLIFPCQYHSTEAKYSPAPTQLLPGQKGDAWEPSKKQRTFRNWGPLQRKVRSYFYPLKGQNDYNVILMAFSVTNIGSVLHTNYIITH
jgi:hypothetical protein